MAHLIALRAKLCQVGGLLAVMIHMDAQARRVAHAFLAYLTLQRPLPSVVLVSNVHLQIVPVREEPVARGTLNATRFAIPSYARR